jgi:hypothetical protein
MEAIVMVLGIHIRDIMVNKSTKFQSCCLSSMAVMSLSSMAVMSMAVLACMETLTCNF